MLFTHDSQQTQFFEFYRQLKEESPNKKELKEKKQEYYRRAQEYGFCNDEISEILSEYLRDREN